MTPRRGDVMDLRAEIASLRDRADLDEVAKQLVNALDAVRICVEKMLLEIEELRFRMDKLEVRR